MTGGKRFSGKLAAPPAVTGPFLSLVPGMGIDAALGGQAPKQPPQNYGDVRVLAYPVASTVAPMPVAAKDGSGKALEVAGLSDGDLKTGVEIARGDAYCQIRSCGERAPRRTRLPPGTRGAG